jgi:hypothetical protein
VRSTEATLTACRDGERGGDVRRGRFRDVVASSPADSPPGAEHVVDGMPTTQGVPPAPWWISSGRREATTCSPLTDAQLVAVRGTPDAERRDPLHVAGAPATAAVAVTPC